MAITEAYTGTNGTWGTEYSLTNASTSIATQTTPGIYQLFLDLNALVAGDQYQLHVYEKTRSADTQRVVYTAFVVGAQSDPILATPTLILMNGWDFTFDRIAGADHTITWSIRKVG